MKAGEALEPADVPAENRAQGRGLRRSRVQETSDLKDASFEGATRLTWCLEARVGPWAFRVVSTERGQP